MKALVGALNQEKALVGALPVIVKTNGSFAALSVTCCEAGAGHLTGQRTPAAREESSSRQAAGEGETSVQICAVSDVVTLI